MEYLIICVLQVIGIGLNAAKKMFELDKKFEDDTMNDVINMFLREDRVTLVISGLILALNLVAHYIIEMYTTLPITISYYPLYAFGIAFVLGYAGQGIVYKYLGKAEQALMKKADKLDNL